ncbi:MAG: sialidase family protein [Polyangiales bacterium]
MESDAGPRMVLLRSDDGGARFTEVLRTQGRMLGFAVRDDGRVLWAGGPDDADRLLRSDDRGATWRRVGDARVQGLRWHAGALYVAADNLRDGYALGRSVDGGETVTPMLRFEDLTGPAECARGTAGRDLCAARWPVLRRMWDPGDGATLADAGTTRDAGLDAAVDAGRVAVPSPGCGCAAGEGSGSSCWAACAAAVSAAVGRGRRATPSRRRSTGGCARRRAAR